MGEAIAEVSLSAIPFGQPKQKPGIIRSQDGLTHGSRVPFAWSIKYQGGCAALPFCGLPSVINTSAFRCGPQLMYCTAINKSTPPSYSENIYLKPVALHQLQI